MLTYQELALALLAVGAVYLYTFARKASRAPLPPGPRRLPVIGNLLDLPARMVWETYMAWAKEYDSAVLHADVFGQPLIVLNTYEACTDLLDKRSASYSGRPAIPMVTELMGWNDNLALMPCAELECRRRGRRLLHEHIGSKPAAVERIRPLLARCVGTFLHRMLDARPGALQGELHYLMGTIILGAAYGITPKPEHDAYVATADAVSTSVTRASAPGAYLVNVLPFLKYVPAWFPGARFQRDAQEWRKAVRALVERPFEEVKCRMADGTAMPSMVCSALSEANSAEEEKDIQATAAVLYSAGMDTTMFTMHFFFRTLLDHPEVQSRAAAEMDAVLLPGKLPGLDDVSCLPYTTAVVHETFRFRPIAPQQGFPRMYTGERPDEYNGYTIPTGSMIVQNIWCSKYPDPDDFKPERFLTADGALDPDVRNPCKTVFGFGRRVCPGKDLAYATLWLVAASTLRIYSIRKAKGKDGKDIEPSSDIISSGVVMCIGLLTGLEFATHTRCRKPAPYKCSFELRNEEARAIIDGLTG
ncbi:cytochrome P450 [Schizophyllum fasciatum]